MKDTEGWAGRGSDFLNGRGMGGGGESHSQVATAWPQVSASLESLRSRWGLPPLLPHPPSRRRCPDPVITVMLMAFPSRPL